MHPARAKAREIAALEVIAENQKKILAGQEQLAAKLELIANLAPASAPVAQANPKSK